MPQISTRQLELRTDAPSFSLLEPKTGKTISLSCFSGKPVLIGFIASDCITVNHIRKEFVRFASEYQKKGLETIAINPNEGGGTEEMINDTIQHHYSFHYLFDVNQDVARAYQVVCTPDFFMLDANHKLYYLGQFDDSRHNNNKLVDGHDIRMAANALLNGEAAPIEQKPSFGCSIIWKERA